MYWYTVFMLIERKLKRIITNLNFARFSGKGHHMLLVTVVSSSLATWRVY